MWFSSHMVVFLHWFPPFGVVLVSASRERRASSGGEPDAVGLPDAGQTGFAGANLDCLGLGGTPTSSIWQTIREDCIYKCVARRSSVKSVCLIDPSRAIQRESPVPCLPPPAPGLPVVDEIGVADDGNRVACRVNQAVSLQRFQPDFHHCGVHARQTGDHLRVVWNAVRDE